MRLWGAFALGVTLGCASGGTGDSIDDDDTPIEGVDPEDAAVDVDSAMDASIHDASADPPDELDAGELVDSSVRDASEVIDASVTDADVMIDAGEVVIVDAGPAPCIASATAPTIYDGDLATGYVTGYEDWQSVVIDLGCDQPVGAFRRHLTSGGSPGGSRGFQGETVEYEDKEGVWRRWTEPSACGWPGYYMSVSTAWSQLAYEWSPWLVLDSPVVARRIRFLWDGNGAMESLNEIELLDAPPVGWTCVR